jgi:plastocyanin
MNRPIAAALACCALSLLSACGSSDSSSSHTATTSGASGTSHASTSTATRRRATTTPSASTVKGSTGAGDSLEATATLKFASPSKSAPVLAGVVQIAYRDIAIFPDTVRVKVGSIIRWTNYDSTPANVTSEGGPLKFASKNFGEGGTYDLSVTKVGVIHYECTLYPATMNGTIEIVA